MSELHELDATDQAALLRDRQVSSVELVTHHLDRIARHDADLGAFVTVTGEQALEQAATADAAIADGSARPFTGVPTAIKDLTMTAGVPTTMGSTVMRDHVPTADAHLVRLMRDAGFISLGKTNTPEFGLSSYTDNDLVGPARTPWDVSRNAGGSSGGAAAAVSAGLVPLAQGSDGGGSIRIPASSCGIFGFKPSRGRVSVGPAGSDWSGLAVDGPLSRTVRDAAALLDTIAHPMPGDLRPLPDPAVPFVPGDVQDPVAVARALDGVDAVCHHAATVGMGLDLSDLPRYAATNDLGTAVLLAGMYEAGVPALVLASSMVVYGEGTYRCAGHGPVAAAPRREPDLAAGRFEPPCPVCARPLEPGLVGEDTPLDPRSVYAATKVAQEHLSTVWARESGGRAAILRYHNVYGPGLPLDTPYAGVAAVFRSAALAGRAPAVFEDGRQRRDFVHVRDVAAACVAAVGSVLTGPTAGPAVRAYNVASGTPRTIMDLASVLARALDAPEPVVTGRYRAGDVRHVTASCERLRAELGWRPTVAFEDGVAELARESVTTG